MWTTFRGRLSTSLNLPSPHQPFALAIQRKSIFFRSFSKQHSGEDSILEELQGEEDDEDGKTGAAQRGVKGFPQRGGAGGKKGKMKWRTASERQRQLERQFGHRQFSSCCKLGNSLLHTLYWSFRRFHYWLCFYDEDIEIDIEDLLTNPFNTQPPSLDELQRLTGFRREWIVFLYRNFKQLCANGRMSQTQWRAVFRLIFKGASDYEFADRTFAAIAGTRSHRMLTFEDLIFCIHDLVNSFSRQEHQNEEGIAAPILSPASSSEGGIEEAVPSINTAQFTFQVMQPDKQGRVDEERFHRYVKCIYKLNASSSNTASGDAETFGMGSNQGAANDQPGSNYNNRRVSVKTRGRRRNTTYSRAPTTVEDEMPSWLVKFSKSQFKTLDTDGDGFITLSDVEKVWVVEFSRDHLNSRKGFQLFHQTTSFEPLVLRMSSQLHIPEGPMPNSSLHRANPFEH